jgi:hypothetical protein
MPQKLMFAWRHTAHVLVGMAIAWLVARYPLHIPDPVANYADAALFALGIAAYGIVQHWMETRQGTAPLARAARWIARWMVLGAPAIPVYGRPDPADGGVRLLGRPAPYAPPSRRIPPDAVPPRP